MKYSYFPGCSLKGLGRAYEESFLAVFKVLGIETKELEDWNCCGATAYMSVDENDAMLLAARNLSLAENEGEDLVAPCAGCYLVLNKAQKYIQKYPAIDTLVKERLKRLDLTYKGEVNIRHPLDILTNEITPQQLKEKIVKPFNGLKVACYYGCQIVRPFATFDNQHHPQSMDQLMSAAGADVIDYPLKTRCCGGSLTGTISEAGERLCYILLKEMKKRGADVIATACPLCQFNLEAYQDDIAKKYDAVDIPVLHFTQVLGLALGISKEELGLQRQIVSMKI